MVIEFPLFEPYEPIIDEEAEYEVEKILEKKTIGGKSQYLVKWKGYSLNASTWEPEENLTHCTELLDRFDPLKDKRYSNGGKTMPEIKLIGKHKIIMANSNTIRKISAVWKSKVMSRSQNPVVQKVPKNTTNFGTFATDLATGISEHAVLDSNTKTMKKLVGKTPFDRIVFKVEWKTRDDGTEPAASFHPFESLKAKCPQILLEYISKTFYTD
jgi:hypothetical protein